MELGQIEIDYRPQISLKGRALADFIAEFSYKVVAEDVPLPEGNTWTLFVD